jgi:hypothetical protein
MSKIIVVSLCIAVTLLFGFQKIRSNHELKERMRRGRIPAAIEDARAKNQKEINLPAPIPLYASVKTLDDALANYSTIIAEPLLQYSEINPDSKEIQTWYKLNVLEFLSDPKNAKCTNCSFAQQVPTQLQPVEANEIILVRNIGTVVSDGVKVTTSDWSFPDFKPKQKYLLFLSIDPRTRIGSIDLGPAGVSTIESDGEIRAVSQYSNQLNTELKNRYGKIDQLQKQLHFRRFPE